MMTLRDVSIASPPTPPCFPDREQWAAYLLQCQEHNKRLSKPFSDAGIYRPEFNFCSDCTPAHGAAMAAVRRCKPSLFRGIPVVQREGAHQ